MESPPSIEYIDSWELGIEGVQGGEEESIVEHTDGEGGGRELDSLDFRGEEGTKEVHSFDFNFTAKGFLFFFLSRSSSVSGEFEISFSTEPVLSTSPSVL